jgi:hypothetical protein
MINFFNRLCTNRRKIILDGSGFIKLAALERCASNLAKLRNWGPNSPEFLALKAKNSAIWTNFWQPADISGDGQVSLEEYLKVADNLISNFYNSTELQDAHKNKANVIFSIWDASNDGQISIREYKQF